MPPIAFDPRLQRTRNLITSLLLALGLLGLTLAADSIVTTLASAAEAPERVTLSGPDIAIYNLAGRASITAGAGPAVEVTVTRAGTAAARLQLARGEAGGRASLRVLYPGTRVLYPELGRGSNTSVRVRDDGTFGDTSRKGGWPGGRTVQVSGSGGGIDAHADLEVSVPKGQKLALYVAAGSVTVTNVDGELRVDTGAGAVNTSGTRGKLIADTGSGEVNVGGAEGSVKVDTGSGDVNVSGVKGAELNLDTGSGSIRARDIEVETLSCDTGSGDVEVVGAKAGRIAVDTGSGSVALTLLSAAEHIAVDTGSGGVTIHVPPGFGADISFDSGSGRFVTDLPVTVRERDHGTFRGRVGDGSARLVVETGSGNLKLSANRVN